MNNTPTQGYITAQATITNANWKDLYVIWNATNPAYGERNYFLDRTHDRAYEVFYQRTSPTAQNTNVEGVLIVHRIR